MTQPTAPAAVTRPWPSTASLDASSLRTGLLDELTNRDAAVLTAAAWIRLRVDGDGQCFYDDMNAAGVDYFGLTRGELVGLTPREAVCPDLAHELDALHRRCIEHRQTLSYYRSRPFPDGNHTFSVVMQPVIEGGVVCAIEVIARDITRHAEAA